MRPDAPLTWLCIGVAGQVLFSLRFVLQWLYSELRRRSLFPLAFWYISIAGSLVLLCYAVHKRDPVFMVGQAGGLLIYARNLQWRLRERRRTPAASASVAKEG